MKISMHILITDAKALLKAQGFEVTSLKDFNTMMNVSKAKYVVNFHDGIQKNKDGSKFYDIALFNNKKLFKAFTEELLSLGYNSTNQIN